MIYLEIDDKDWGSGCVHAVFQEIINHGGKITKAHTKHENIITKDEVYTNLMHFLEGMTREEGRC
jgi:hypothetical protein